MSTYSTDPAEDLKHEPRCSCGCAAADHDDGEYAEMGILRQCFNCNCAEYSSASSPSSEPETEHSE